MIDEFKKELEILINKHCIENECDMPDFILAEMICNIIIETGKSSKKNLDWHGCDSVCHPRKVDADLCDLSELGLFHGVTCKYHGQIVCSRCKRYISQK